MPPPEPQKQEWRGWKYLAIASSIAGIISFLLYFLPGKKRELLYAFSEQPTTIVKAGQASDLRVFYKDIPVATDVSGIKVAIWNAGAESIRRENVLTKSVMVRFSAGVSILSARVRRTVRGISNFRCAQKSAATIVCDWDILEEGDAGLLEIVYAGTNNAVTLEGEIEGRVPIRVLRDPPWWEAKGSASAFIFALGTMSSLFLANVLLDRIMRRSRSELQPWVFGAVVILMCLMMLAAFLYSDQLAAKLTQHAPFPL